MATIINNTASVTYGYGRSVTDIAVSNMATASLTKEYSVDGIKTSNNQSFRNGENITYQILVKNDGSSSLYNITVTDDLGGAENPLAFVDGSGTLNYNGSIISCVPTSFNPLTFTLDSPLLSGQTATITYVARVSLTLSESISSITNTATISANEGSSSGELISLDSDLSHTISRAEYAELTVNKQVSESEIVTGQSFSYIITLSNSGSLEANGVIITDTLPEGFVISEITSNTGDTTTTFSTDDYTIEPTTNTLTLPTGGALSIFVPASSEGVSGTTIVTITGAIS